MERLLRIFQNINLITAAAILWFSCEKQGEVEYKLVERNGQQAFGKFVDGVEDSVFVFKYPNGKTSSYEEYYKGTAVLQVFFFENGDTLAYSDTTRFIAFYENRKIETIQKQDFSNGKSEGIVFDSLGRLYSLNSDLLFLTKSDSFHLSRDYPDWQEQVRAWKLARKPS